MVVVLSTVSSAHSRNCHLLPFLAIANCFCLKSAIPSPHHGFLRPPSLHFLLRVRPSELIQRSPFSWALCHRSILLGVSNEKLWLRITETHVSLHELESWHVTHAWPLAHVQRFGLQGNVFMIEIGRATTWFVRVPKPLGHACSTQCTCHPCIFSLLGQFLERSVHAFPSMHLLS